MSFRSHLWSDSWGKTQPDLNLDLWNYSTSVWISWASGQLYGLRPFDKSQDSLRNSGRCTSSRMLPFDLAGGRVHHAGRLAGWQDEYHTFPTGPTPRYLYPHASDETKSWFVRMFPIRSLEGCHGQQLSPSAVRSYLCRRTRLRLSGLFLADWRGGVSWQLLSWAQNPNEQGLGRDKKISRISWCSTRGTRPALVRGTALTSAAVALHVPHVQRKADK